MKGIDLTEAQMQSAREFEASLRNPATSSGSIIHDQAFVTLRVGDLARLIALYGAVRYIAGRDGTGGTLDEPGPVRSPRDRRIA